jgi:hypothetical protein
MIDASFYMAEQLYGLRFTEITRHRAGVPPRRAGVEGRGKPTAATSGCSTATTSRAPASARARGPPRTAGHETFTGTVN